MNAAKSIQRPKPRGVNQRGMPTWSGLELKLYRQSLGLTQASVTRRTGIWESAISASIENLRGPVSYDYDKVMRYLDALEEEVSNRQRERVTATAELVKLQAKLPEIEVDTTKIPTPRWRTAFEAQAILDERNAAEHR